MTAVAKKKTGEIAEFDPTMFEADAGIGTQMEQDDLALPFLKIISALDPLLDDESFTGRKGDIYNTVSGNVYAGKEGIQVIPCAYQRRFIQWAPRGQGSGAPQAIYTPQEKLPETKRDPQDNHQHFVVVLNEDGSAETALIAMKSTQLKKSRKWNSMVASLTLQGANGPFTPPRFSHIYHLKTLSEENSKGSWHGWEMSRVGPVTDGALYMQAKQFAESISSGDVVVKHGEEEEVSNNPGF